MYIYERERERIQYVFWLSLLQPEDSMILEKSKLLSKA